ncbi:hypothetical protein [Gracilibacillus sp. Marseille-QA3620]
MGALLHCYCQDCEYSLDLVAGVGSAYVPRNFEVVYKTNEDNMWVQSIESLRVLDEVELIVNKKHGQIDHYGFAIYYSESCKRLCSRFYFELYYLEDDGQRKVYIPTYFDKYGKELIRVDIDDISLLDLECPKCKSTRLTLPKIKYLWD